MQELGISTLPEVSTGVEVFGYDRAAVRAGIVHFGVGNFHRAHQAVYLDRLLHLPGHEAWGICGVGVRPRSSTHELAWGTDHLFTLLSQDPDGSSEARIIGSLVEYLHAPADTAAVVRRLADPDVHLVTLTITEGGYGIDDATGEFDPRDPGVLADLADPRAEPASVFGFLVDGLRRRRAAGTRPFTVMSCDNLPGNGEVCRSAVLSFARRYDPDMVDWIAAEVAFPATMVDRITPAVSDRTIAEVAERIGVSDPWPVRAESFTQWVVQDHFSAERPPLEQVGVQLVADVEPYELMKLRLLNASHQAMAHLGVLAGMSWVHEVGEDDTFTRFLLDYMHHDAVPTLAPVPGVDLAAYCAELVRRFGNQAVADTLLRLAVDSSDRIPKFLLPVLRQRLAQRADVTRPVLVLAAWSRFLEGRTDAGAPIEPQDARAGELGELLVREAAEPGVFLTHPGVFGDLAEQPGVSELFVTLRARLAADGARAVLADVVAAGGGAR